MGSAIAPLLANEFNLAGVISDGVFFKTWFEHMLEIERRILGFKGNSEAEIVEKNELILYPPILWNAYSEENVQANR